MMASIGGHLVRIQGCTEEYVYIDDPYGSLDVSRKLDGLNGYLCNSCKPKIDNRNLSGSNVGNNSKWQIEDAVKLLIRFEWYYNK